MHFNPFPPIEIQYHRTMAHFRRRLYFAMSFGFFPQCPFQQNPRSIDLMMRNSLVEIQNVVGEQLSGNLLIMRTLFEDRLPPKNFVLSIIIFRVEQAGSAGAANTASRRRIRQCCFRFKPAPLATHQPPALWTSLWN
jgi:hypothetical protein